MKPFFKIRNILLFIIAVTIVYNIARSERIFTAKDIQPLSTSRVVTSIQFVDFMFIPDGVDSVIAYNEDAGSQFCRIAFHNLAGDILSHNNFFGYYITRDMGSASTSYFYADTSNKSLYSIISKNGSEAYLVRSYKDERNDYRSAITHFYTHPVYESLRDSFCIKNQTKFYAFEIMPMMQDSIRVDHYRDGRRIAISKNIDEKIDYRFPPYEPFHPYLYEIADKVSKATGKAFSAQDIHWIYNFFARNKRFETMFFSKPNYPELGFCPAEVVARVDGNHDGYKDLLIYMKGYRWVNARLICFDEKNQKLVWIREVTPCDHVKMFKIYDIDNDHQDEILFSTGASYDAPDLDYYDKWDSTGVPLYSYFRILNAEGTDKIINSRKIEFVHKKAFSIPFFIYLKEKNKVVLALLSNDSDPNYIYTIDLRTNRIDTIKYVYQQARFFHDDGKTITLLSGNRDSNGAAFIKKQVFSHDLDLIQEKTIETDKHFSVLHQEPVTFFGKPHFITPYGIYDFDLDEVYRFKNPIGKFLKKNNGIIFVPTDPDMRKETNLVHIKFSQAYSPDRWALYLLFFWIFLLGVYYLVKYIVFQPINTGANSYIELYSVFNKMFFWIPQGNIRKVFKIPNHLSYTKETFLKLLHDLGGKPEPFLRRRFFGTRYEVYEIPSKDEWIIIQRIAHDIKNRMLSIGMNVENLEECLPNCPKAKDHRFLDSLKDDIEGVSEIAVKLSRFSQLERLQTEPVEMEPFLKRWLDRYLNHPKMSVVKTEFQLPGVKTMLDIKLFEMVLCNLLDNALEAIVENQWIRIEACRENDEALIRISNPANIKPEEIERLWQLGYSTKKNGSGLGIPIAKQIIDKHKGEMTLEYSNGIFLVTIKVKLLKEV